MICLDDWQKAVLAWNGDIGLCTGRRVGKTYIFSRKAVEYMIKYGMPIIVVSLTEDQAFIIILMAWAHAQERYPDKIGRGKYKPTKKTLTIMRKGKPIIMKSRPVGNTGNATRGFEGGVLFVDEASRMPKLFWIAALPILLTVAHSVIWMCSTPFGKQGYFWKRYNESMILKDPNARFKFFYQNTVDVINNRKISKSWTKEQRETALKVIACDKKDMSKLEFGQEYMGLFLEDLRQYFADKLIMDCQTIDEHKQVIPLTGTNFLGADIAGMGGDKIVQVGLNRDERAHLRQIDQQVKVKQLLPETYRQILASNEKFSYAKLGIDDGGLGKGILHPLMENDDTKRKVVALNNASRNVDHKGEKKKTLMKEDMYTNLLWQMENANIDLWKSDETFQSLRSIQSEVVDGKLRIFGKDTHIAEALIRAAWLAKTKHLKLWIRSS